MSEKEDCSTCRHHTSRMREPVELGAADDNIVEDMVNFDDKNPKPYYFCVASEGPRKNQDIGFEPVRCEAYARPSKAVNAEADAAMARFESRMKGRS